MKNLPAIFLVAFPLCTCVLRADETTPAAPTTEPVVVTGAAAGSPAESATSAPTPPVYTEPPQLFPEMPMSEPTPAASKSSRQRKTELGSEEMNARIRFREVKTRASKEPGVQQQLAVAQATKSSAEKREAYRIYYKMLYAQMVKIDPSLKARVRAKEAEALASLDDTHIGATPKPARGESRQLPVVGEQVRPAQ